MLFAYRHLLFCCILTLGAPSLSAQQEGVDTTSAGYQTGYKIGSWLPFIIIFTLALMVVIRSYRLSRKNRP